MPKRTAFYNEEKKLGARFTEFAGWELPLYYSSIIDEHMAVRNSCGLFDISHLGKISVTGEQALPFLQRVTTNDIKKVPVGSGAYTLFCNDTGGIIDDDIIYRMGTNDYLIVANAISTKLLLEWLNGKKPDKVDIRDLTEDLCLLAIQGPQSPQVLKSVFNENAERYKRYTVKIATLLGNKFTITRSGYTGEDGFEIFCEPSSAIAAWKAMLRIKVKPAGLGARDTLRLEMGYPLYSQDLTIKTSPVEAGLLRFVSLDKGEFVGRTAIFDQVERSAKKKLSGFVVERGIPRSGDIAFNTSGDEIGTVTSGGYSPILKKGIGMAYIKSDYSQIGTPVEIRAERKELKGLIAKRPFIEKQKQKNISVAS